MCAVLFRNINTYNIFTKAHIFLHHSLLVVGLEMVKGVLSITDMTYYGWHRLPVYLGLAEVAQNSHRPHRYFGRDDRQISIRVRTASDNLAQK